MERAGSWTSIYHPFQHKILIHGSENGRSWTKRGEVSSRFAGPLVASVFFFCWKGKRGGLESNSRLC